MVNCAGRTRSILGAESLRRAGVPNKVVALRNGTMGWELAGLRCERGRTERYARACRRPLGTGAAARQGLRRAVRGRRHRPRSSWPGSGRSRPHLYVLDVREPAEFRAGHRPGSRNAPAGNWCRRPTSGSAVRGARIVLVDDTGVRARMAARAGCARWAIATCSSSRAALEEVRDPGTATSRCRSCARPCRSIDVPGSRSAGRRRPHGGGRSRPQHRLPRGPYPRRALGHPHAAGRSCARSSRAPAMS